MRLMARTRRRKGSTVRAPPCRKRSEKMRMISSLPGVRDEEDQMVVVVWWRASLVWMSGVCVFARRRKRELREKRVVKRERVEKDERAEEKVEGHRGDHMINLWVPVAHKTTPPRTKHKKNIS